MRPAQNPDIIRSSVERFLRCSGFTKQSGSWYRLGEAATVVVNLQRSQYRPSYHLNVAASIHALPGPRYPKENRCHVRTRLERLVAPSRQAEVRDLLDLETPYSDENRASRLESMLDEYLSPIAEGVTGPDGLRSGAGRAMISASLVTGDALDWLDRTPSQEGRGR